ncbi:MULTISPECIES: DeoR/GlpR family DNA-binding transcription regulator [Paenarthrobacter]|uniref:DeoR/GlpR family DNA-binding transcription regulator n=1 Tax=Paenarthrobacter TaxID=1742992 RepID=UPI00074D4379|nr:DeoR/GlpR family DNA-binding transcription regulator [Paenarthrobacter ureafaciens]AMB40375.1 DeoR family transcriptional regulator [Arthrobacter sp. ATCC 21022]KUR63577.1 DeoR faimly transcriptional regulator [Arthrobacter sp. ATCC 21022]RWW91536.1 DeoR/GlpR transcriptional regulator [Paenarthrobacter ureafaciens]BCW84152.1 transcriptional regulator [Arthrobacter sp. NicSoilE8]
MSVTREEAALTPRQRTILDELGRRGFLSTTDLAGTFDVSDMTIRRDTRALSKMGLVKVVHGGVSAVEGHGQNADFAARAREDAAAKRRVARTCVDLIAERDAIILDAGTTTYQIAQELPATFTGTIITHSAPAIQRCLQLTSARTICLGGELLLDSQAFNGAITVSAAEGLHAKTAFIGVSGIHDEAFYIERDVERATKLALMASAEQVVVVATHQKMLRYALARLAAFDAVDILVTDAPPPAEIMTALEAAGVRLIVAA